MNASAAPEIDKGSKPAGLARGHPRALRFSEKLILVFLAYLTLAAWFFPVDAAQRWLLLTTNCLASIVLAVLSRVDQPVRHGTVRGHQQFRGRFLTLAPTNGSRLLAALRDWLPLALILMVYRESGLFVRPDLSHHLDQLFVVWDRYILENEWAQRAIAAGGSWLAGYLEITYLLCYPLVPMGLAAVLVHNRRAGRFVESKDGQGGMASPPPVDYFWTTVLLAAFWAYGAFPFFPLTPPRVLYHDLPEASFSLLRGANLWLLDHYGVQACIFPSGHVAVVTATALAVRRQRPWLGLAFLWAAFSIAVATVLLRYHYTADALVGAAVAVAAGFVSSRIHAGETN
jgi:membrane-associated phospholipid phosphatase